MMSVPSGLIGKLLITTRTQARTSIDVVPDVDPPAHGIPYPHWEVGCVQGTVVYLRLIAPALAARRTPTR
jgi:hypothetical protein